MKPLGIFLITFSFVIGGVGAFIYANDMMFFALWCAIVAGVHEVSK